MGDAFQIPDANDRTLWNAIINMEWIALDDCEFYSYEKPLVYDDNWYTQYEGTFLTIPELVNYLKQRIKRIEYLPEWAIMTKGMIKNDSD